MKEYLVIAELDNKGYIIGTTDDLSVAESKMEELFSIANQYPFNELYKFNADLKDFASYPINGNAMYFGMQKKAMSNGMLTISILDLTKRTFSLQQFISERSNTSYAFFSVDEAIIPEIVFYAN